MKNAQNIIGHMAVAVLTLILTIVTAHAEIAVENATITDVTPSGFAVVFQTAVPASPGIAVFADAAGSTDITSQLEAVPFPLQGGDPDAIDAYDAEMSMLLIREQAMNLGMLKIAVQGCAPGTTYYFRVTAQGDGDSGTWPAAEPAAVTTALETAFMADVEQLLVTLTNNAEDLEAGGWIVTAGGTEVLSPVSAVVNDGAGDNQAVLNLSHLFAVDGLSWQPDGAQFITVQVLRAGDGPLSQSVELDFSDLFVVSGLHVLTINMDESQDSDGDGLPDYLENQGCTDPLDVDNDDDGIADGVEDADQNGQVDAGETDPCDIDTDGDGIQDGTEKGITDPVPDPDGAGPLAGTDTNVFQPDLDDGTTTNPLDRDSDDDGAWDGAEDVNTNGRMDAGESDPMNDASLPAAVKNIQKGYNIVAIPSDVTTQSDLNDWLARFGPTGQVTKVVAYDSAAGRLVTLVPGAANPPATLQNGQAVIVYAAAEYQAGFTSVDCSTPTLVSGYNLVGYSCPGGVDSAHDLLNALGSGSVVSIQRYAPEKGAFETAGFDGTTIVGVDFPIVAGEGYVVNVR